MQRKQFPIRAIALAPVLLVAVLLFTACQAQQAAPAVETTEEAPAPESTITVAVVAGGEIGDNGFIDSANEGLKMIEDELGLPTKLYQGREDPDRYLDILLSAAEEADLVFVVPGYFFTEELKKVVPEYPDTTFIYADGESDIPGMASIKYLENEGSFLAGALATLLTTRTDVLPKVDSAKVIGQMGGADMPVIHNFMVGYEQGAKYIDPEITVITRFAGTHFDPAKGRETALAMYQEGADIVFQIAGPTGLGVFEAAKEADKYVIGVDADQKSLAPENTVASMRKRVGISILDVTKIAIDGKLQKDEVYYYGLAKGGVGIDYGAVGPDLVPQDVKDKIAELEQKIIDGEIQVERYSGE